MLKQNLLELLKCGSYPESSSFSPALSFLMWRANFITVWISTGTCLTGLLLSVVLTTCSPRSGTSWKTLPFFHVGLCFLMHVRWDPGPSTVASHGSVWCWWLPNVSLQLLHVLPACPQLPSAPLSFNSLRSYLRGVVDLTLCVKPASYHSRLSTALSCFIFLDDTSISIKFIAF